MPWLPGTLVACGALAANLDSYRYFQSSGYDVYLKRKAKGRGDDHYHALLGDQGPVPGHRGA